MSDSFILMVMPAVELDEAIFDGDDDAAAATGLALGALPPGLKTSIQLLREPILAPRYDGVAKLRHFKFYRCRTTFDPR